MPMNARFTQFNFINSEDGPKKESEEWNAIMKEGENLMFLEDKNPEYSPSDQSIKKILDFARSYQTLPSKNLKFVEIYLN